MKGSQVVSFALLALLSGVLLPKLANQIKGDRHDYLHNHTEVQSVPTWLSRMYALTPLVRPAPPAAPLPHAEQRVGR